MFLDGVRGKPRRLLAVSAVLMPGMLLFYAFQSLESRPAATAAAVFLPAPPARVLSAAAPSSAIVPMRFSGEGGEATYQSILTQMEYTHQKFCAKMGCFMFNVESSVGLPLEHFSMAIESEVAKAIVHLLAAEDKSKSVFFDVGMNSGFFSLLAARMGFDVVAFDPQPGCVALAADSIRASGLEQRVQIMNVGLGEGGQPIQVHTAVCHGGYSWPDSWAGKGQPVEVGVRPLGEFLRGRTVAVMKMDVEANEVWVLKSALPELLQGRVHHLIVEMKMTAWDSKGVTRDEGMELFRQIFEASTKAVRLETGETVKDMVMLRRFAFTSSNILFYMRHNK